MSEHTANMLARLADCASPDGPESAGAQFLISVQDSVNEVFEYEVTEDTVSEIADGAPDVYTHTMWAEFVDLAAYNEDPTELGADGSDMEKCARICLYMIAERLAQALISEHETAEVDA